MELSWENHIFHATTVDELYDKVFDIMPLTSPTSGKDFFKVKLQSGMLNVGIQNIGNDLYMARVVGNIEIVFSGKKSVILHELMSTIDKASIMPLLTQSPLIQDSNISIDVANNIEFYNKNSSIIQRLQEALDKV